ncbi:MAG: DEAD/DEAH box helicase, partial [Bacteroidota bacterium]
TGNNIEILVINIDSFAKDENIINKPNDKLTGQRPIEFIQVVSPLVIVDEPQNMETEKRKEALQKLNPLCTLRYSATHKNIYNLVYSLNPVKAYDLGLVKQIEVDSIVTEDSNNEAFVGLDAIKTTKTKVTAKLTIDYNNGDSVKQKKITVKVGDDLYRLSNEREIYNNGYIVEEIDAGEESLTFSNGAMLYLGESQGGLTDEVMKYQIRKTIEEHFKKERKFRPKGIKVLSLFFIDKVANYRQYDETGNPTKGKFARWFEEMYAELGEQSAFKELAVKMESSHNGYFSQDKKGKLKDTNGVTQADDDTYRLIMRDKERLLSLDNPLRFIFSHSALREGWDNPNVFQICTLNESKSEIKRRQEIGRGLRLAVNEDGERIYDKNINRLTVIANEAYDDFAKSLQKEIEDDCGVSFKGRIKNKRDRAAINYRKGFELDENFKEIWDKIKHQTTYRVAYDTKELIENASKAVKALPPIKTPLIRSTKKRVTMDDKGVSGDVLTEKAISVDATRFNIPDVLGYIQNRTELTRSTIYEIIENSKRLNDILVNPQLFLDLSIKAIKAELYELMINGIRYDKLGERDGESHFYEMRLFEESELEIYLDSVFHEVVNSNKTIYDNYIPLDSEVENQFAKDCESSEQVEFYFKLPSWFKIPTPIGNYNPDWALIFKEEKKIYFVAETKSTKDLSKLRNDERLKIKCGEKHFAVIDDVAYKHVTKLGELVE